MTYDPGHSMGMFSKAAGLVVTKFCVKPSGAEGSKFVQMVKVT